METARSRGFVSAQVTLCIEIGELGGRGKSPFWAGLPLVSPHSVTNGLAEPSAFFLGADRRKLCM